VCVCVIVHMREIIHPCNGVGVSVFERKERQRESVCESNVCECVHVRERESRPSCLVREREQEKDIVCVYAREREMVHPLLSKCV